MTYILKKAGMYINFDVLFHKKRLKRGRTQNNKHKKTRKSKNKIKITKILRIQNNEVQDFLKEHSTHKITCPSWGVSGHYRHYKNGKVVWIKPYKKGKKRDSNKDYQSKTYSI